MKMAQQGDFYTAYAATNIPPYALPLPGLRLAAALDEFIHESAEASVSQNENRMSSGGRIRKRPPRNAIIAATRQ
jgi:hypothetical protein